MTNPPGAGGSIRNATSRRRRVSESSGWLSRVLGLGCEASRRGGALVIGLVALSIVLYVWSVTAFDDYFDSVEAGRPDWRLGLLQGLIFESAFILVLAAGGVWGYYVSHYERRVRVYNAELFARSRDGERIGEPIDLVCVAKAADAGQGAGSSVSVGRLTRGIAIVAMLVAALAVVVTAIAAYLWVAEFAAATAGRAWQGPGQQGAWQFYLPAGAVFALLAAALWTWNGHRQFAYAVHRST